MAGDARASTNRTYRYFRPFFCRSLMLMVTGRKQLRHAMTSQAAASAKGGIGISRTVRHRSCPRPSARHMRAATAACRDVKVTTAYVESRATASTAPVELRIVHSLTVYHKLRSRPWKRFRLGRCHSPVSTLDRSLVLDTSTDLVRLRLSVCCASLTMASTCCHKFESALRGRNAERKGDARRLEAESPKAD